MTHSLLDLALVGGRVTDEDAKAAWDKIKCYKPSNRANGYVEQSTKRNCTVSDLKAAIRRINRKGHL